MELTNLEAFLLRDGENCGIPLPDPPSLAQLTASRLHVAVSGPSPVGAGSCDLSTAVVFGRERLLSMLIPHRVLNRDVVLYVSRQRWLPMQRREHEPSATFAEIAGCSDSTRGHKTATGGGANRNSDRNADRNENAPVVLDDASFGIDCTLWAEPFTDPRVYQMHDGIRVKSYADAVSLSIVAERLGGTLQCLSVKTAGDLKQFSFSALARALAHHGVDSSLTALMIDSRWPGSRFTELLALPSLAAITCGKHQHIDLTSPRPRLRHLVAGHMMALPPTGRLGDVCPALELADFSQTPERIAALASCPSLTALKDAGSEKRMPEEAICPVARMQNIRVLHLHALTFWGSTIGDSIAALPSLRDLNLSGIRVTPAVCDWGESNPVADRIQTESQDTSCVWMFLGKLTLSTLSLHGQGLLSSLEHIGGPQLTSLDLRIDDSATDANAITAMIARCPSIGNLQLQFTTACVGQSKLLLASIGELPALEDLTLHRMNVSKDDALAHLHPALNLRALEIVASTVSEKGFAALAALPKLKTVHAKAVAGISPASVLAFTTPQWFGYRGVRDNDRSDANADDLDSSRDMRRSREGVPRPAAHCPAETRLETAVVIRHTGITTSTTRTFRHSFAREPSGESRAAADAFAEHIRGDRIVLSIEFAFV